MLWALALVAFLLAGADAGVVSSVSFISGHRLLSSSTGNSLVLQFTPATTVAINDKFVITMPTGFAFSAATAVVQSGFTGTLTCTDASNVLTCTRQNDGTTATASVPIQLTLGGVTAPGTAGTTTGLTVEIQDNSATSQDTANTAAAGPQIFSALGTCTLVPAQLFAGSTQSATVTLGTLATALAATDEIVIQFPAGVTFATPVASIGGDTISSTTATGNEVKVVLSTATGFTVGASPALVITNVVYPRSTLSSSAVLHIRTQTTGGAAPKDLTDVATHAATTKITGTVAAAAATLAIDATSGSVTATLAYAVPTGLTMTVTLTGTPAQHVKPSSAALVFSAGDTVKTFTLTSQLSAGLGVLTITVDATGGTDSDIYDSFTTTVTIEAGPVAGLMVQTEASSSLVDTAFTIQPVIAVVDAAGNVLTGGGTDTVTCTVSAGPGGAALSGTATEALVSGTGLADFAGNALELDTLGTYTLTFTATLTGSWSGGPFTATQTIHIVEAPTSRHVTASINSTAFAAGTLPTTIVTLLPYNGNAAHVAHIFACKISSLPATGKIYQISDVYSTYGYSSLPQKGAEITSINTYLTDSQHRLIYEAPLGFVHTRLTYTATAFTHAAASAGNVDITSANSAAQLVSSNFDTNNDAWTVVQGSSVAATWSGTSTGALNMYITAADGTMALNANNDVRWHFLAPSAFNSDFALAYNGNLVFTLGSLAGNFTDARTAPFNFVEITCSTCASGAGITLAQRNIVWDGTVQTFSFTLNEAATSAWGKDPKDRLVTAWSAPTACEFFDVLSGITSLKIYGDHTNGYEAVGLDSVSLTAGAAAVADSCY